MAEFLQVLILKGSTAEEFIQTLPELVAEHPGMNLGGGTYRFHTYPSGVGVICHSGVIGYEPLAKALSEKLGRSVMLLYIYDGDQWGYYFYDSGRKLDIFNPVPDYFTGDESQTELCKGNAQVVARHFGVPQQSIEPYLVRWTEELSMSGAKARADDQYTYGDCWQMADFMRALHYPYDGFAPQEEPKDAQPSAPAMPFDTAIITTDLERWIADTYVIWSGRGGGNWKLFGGYPKNEENAAILKKLLAQDWKIENLADGINTVNVLIADKEHQTPDTDGWDFCRGMQLIGVFYLVDWIDRPQMIAYSRTIGEIMQRHFKSWEALCESYLAGHAAWCQKTFSSVEAQQSSAQRRAIYEQYKKMKDGPYRQPWDMALTEGAAEAAHKATTQTPATSYFDQWLAQEETWIGAYRHKARKTIVVGGLVMMAVLSGLMIAIDRLYNKGSGSLFAAALPGIQVSLLILVPFYWFVMHRLHKGRISQIIRKTTQLLGMDAQEQEALGVDMLAAIQTNSCRLDYQEKAPHSMATPARLLVSKQYFYQTGTRMAVMLIRRSDVESIQMGQERKLQRVNHTTQSFTLHTVYFYYRSSRERRVGGDERADNGIGFFDPATRDRAYAMIDRQLKSQ